MRVILRNPSVEPQIEQQGKDTALFRQYAEEISPDDKIQGRVRQLYRNQHTQQTVDKVSELREKWLKFDHAKLQVLDCLDLLSEWIDESDPDVDVANIVHAYQTAERLRKAHPHQDWLHLAGLVHDMGKVMAMWGEAQQFVTGDTYPVGCAPAPSIVYRATTFAHNPDQKDPRYNTELGIYTKGCGMENLLMAWGHDEYMFQVLDHHEGCTLPAEALYIIRFHSFYPWHTGLDYKHFENETDRANYKWLMELNKFDLYSKGDPLPDIPALKPYYQGLVDKYIPGLVNF